MPESLNTPVASPPEATNKLGTAKATLCLLKEAGITAGSVKTNDQFDLDVEVMQIALLEPFEKLRVLAGESPVLAAWRQGGSASGDATFGIRVAAWIISALSLSICDLDGKLGQL
ncbi:hypothetical protein PC129_g17836 [Phytophthora cactorum]|uniref:Uncharacterized protein n=1 Tax=Phytophthora cactorum TaxID=29920 RepID=A0A329REK5_9STRA|nr:hypothetical protein Pcac1_g9135 [Phytophthora cactorum]KAG2796181.1 hypothetical protein PC112_g22312 [Phytophthora cactorum]KAG2797544.1 hypothetical protein PC111_g21249 [Phytophthora cactorum]KAG2823172.1 hypothetical protein PC113_g22223 [Phytophthora cactorum]KAG2875081.1 hypothetical protein PC114_g24927 [Phytophthora cactorum]